MYDHEIINKAARCRKILREFTSIFEKFWSSCFAVYSLTELAIARVYTCTCNIFCLSSCRHNRLDNAVVKIIVPTLIIYSGLNMKTETMSLPQDEKFDRRKGWNRNKMPQGSEKWYCAVPGLFRLINSFVVEEDELWMTISSPLIYTYFLLFHLICVLNIELLSFQPHHKYKITYFLSNITLPLDRAPSK